MKTVSDVVKAIHEYRPEDKYGTLLIAMMDECNARDLKSVSFEDALSFYNKLIGGNQCQQIERNLVT